MSYEEFELLSRVLKEVAALKGEMSGATEFILVRKALVREGFAMDSAMVGFLEEGDVLYGQQVRTDAEGRQRVQFELGWVTVSSNSGTVFAVPHV